MASMTRRNFLEAAAATGAMAGLAACGNAATPSGEEPDGVAEPDAAPAGDPLAAPDASAYPIDPDGSDVAALWTAEEVGRDGWTRITQDGAPTLGISDTAKIIQVGGYAFKDLDGDGRLSIWEDWRQPADVRATALAAVLPIDFVQGLLIHDTTNGLVDNGADATDQNGNSETESIRNLHYRTILDRAVANGTYQLPHAKWVNTAQSVAEAEPFGVPVSVTTDPAALSGWSTNNLSYAATFDPAYVREVADLQARQYRAVGVTMVLGPQIDLASEPRWTRTSGTFGEDPALSRDMTNAHITGSQSTFDEAGNDLGWGTGSIMTMMKHWPGDGSGEGGRESHSKAGEFTVYPGGNFDATLVPFVDGGMNLDSSTGKAAGVMGSYSIAYSDDGEYGDLMGTSYSEYKLDLLRNKYAYDGIVCTDWRVTQGNAWGAEEMSVPERYARVWELGTDQIGGDKEPDPAGGYEALVAKLGAEEAEANLRGHGERVLLGHFRLGLFENAYVETALIDELIDGDEVREKTLESHRRAVILLKNAGGVVHEGDGSVPKVYVPRKFTPSNLMVPPDKQPTLATWDVPVDVDALSGLIQVVTDPEPTTPTGEPEGAFAPEDIVRASTEDVADCDFALVFAASPATESSYDGETDTYLPIALQYAPYTADGQNVRRESVSGFVVDGAKENRSYFGNTSVTKNESDLKTILDARSVMGDKPVIVAMDATNPLCFGEFEPQVDAILLGFGEDSQAYVEAATGAFEPSALLPVQMPRDMDAVEAQNEDVPRDMDCYVDSEGNTYDFAFGLDWAGVIDDERVATYRVAPLTAPQTA